MKYYTLLIKQMGANGLVRWSPEFGDFDRETVEGEIDSLVGSYCMDFDRFYKKSDFRIIATDDTQEAINAKVREVNGEPAPAMRAKWCICANCDGEGAHSKRLGVISRDDWSDDEMDAYMGGAYDDECEVCQGTGKVREDENRVERYFSNDADYFRYMA